MMRGRFLMHLAVALTALGLLGLSFAAWLAARAQDEVEVRTRFEFRAAEITQALRGRLLDYETVLRGASAMLAIAPSMRQPDWVLYVESLGIAAAYPGVRAVGYAPLDQDRAVVRFVAPPDDANRRALGYDLFAEPRRRAAMQTARDTAEPAATAGLTLLQDDGNSAIPGVVVFMPVYRDNRPVHRLEARREAVTGYVYGAFRVSEFVRGTLGDTPGIRLRLSDVTEGSAPGLLYEGGSGLAATTDFARSDTLPAHGRRWQIDTVATESFVSDAGSDRPQLVLASGIAITVLLAGLVWSLLNTREQARRLAQRMIAAREELERFRIAVDQHDDTMLMVDALSMHIVYANDGACRSLGYPREELIGKPASVVFADRDDARLAREYNRLLESREGSAIEQARFRRRDGSEFPVEISRYSVTTSSGERFILGIARDTTQRLEAERALRESEQRLELALESSGLALFDWDLQSGLVYLGKEWMVILGGSPATSVTPMLKLQQRVHPDDLPGLLEQVRRLLKGETQVYRLEHRVKGLDGEWRWIESVARVTQRDAQDQALRVTGTNADIRERKEVGELKNAFIANVSHELRTPLTSIVASLELLREGAAGELPEKAKHFVTMASANGDRLVDLINDILDLEKAEAGRMRLRLQPVDVAPFLKQVLLLNSGYAQRHGVHYVVRPPKADLTALADPDRLLQVMTNFVSNAAKVSPPGGDVTITAEAKGDRIVFSVLDDGPGIPPEFRDRVFGKFEQADSTRGGSGLGLALSKTITEKMGGRIGFESEPGRGARFYVDMPAAPPRD